jgi:hypothetical protein
VLNDFVNSGLAYRAGRGDEAVYRIASDSDFEDSAARERSTDFVVWLYVFRDGPAAVERVVEQTGLGREAVDASLRRLAEAGRVQRDSSGRFESEVFEVPWDGAQGWEAAALDHFRAMVTTIGLKLGTARRSKGLADVVGGSTWTLDVWPGHPFEAEARGTLGELRKHVERLRNRIDGYNATHPSAEPRRNVVVYLGQYVQPEDSEEDS